VYSKYAGTEVEFNDSKHLILKEDDVIGILESDDVKDMKPLNDRVLIKVCFPATCINFVRDVLILDCKLGDLNSCPLVTFFLACHNRLQKLKTELLGALS
jgi:hypothetical protein